MVGEAIAKKQSGTSNRGQTTFNIFMSFPHGRQISGTSIQFVNKRHLDSRLRGNDSSLMTFTN